MKLYADDKERIEESKLDESKVESKVEELKKKLKKTSSEYWMNMYKILSEIYDLRNTVEDDYTIKDLYEEVDDYFENEHQVRRIMCLRHATKKTWNRMKEGEITFSKVSSVFRTNVDLAKDDKRQNKFIKKVIDEEMSHQDAKHKARANSSKKKSLVMSKVDLLDSTIDNHWDKMDSDDKKEVKKRLSRLKENALGERWMKLDEDMLELLREINEEKKSSFRRIMKQALRKLKRSL